YHLGNLVGILDMNRLGQRGETELGWNSAAYAARARAFGWHAIEIDGHDLSQIDRALAEAAQPRDVPSVIIAKTVKGRGVSFLENQEGWHGKALNEQQAQQAIAELGGTSSISIQVHKPEDGAPTEAPRSTMTSGAKLPKLPSYEIGSSVATRKAYGDALR